MTSINNTKEEVGDHEDKGNPHSGSAAKSDLHDRPSPGANITDDANGNWDAADSKKTTSEVQSDALIHSAGFAPGFGG